MELEVSLYPKAFYIGGVNVGYSVVIAWCVIALLILILIPVNIYIRKRFTEKPKGLQNLLEMAVDGIYNFAKGKVGAHTAEMSAPIAMTLMLYVFFGTFVEIFGIAPATEDLNCTIALGLCSFLMVNVTAVRTIGVKGRLHGLATPSAVVFPIKVLTDCIAPFSMGIRLFANVLVGGVIMQLIYAVVPVVLPAALASYFNVLHVGIQTFVFGLLFLTYTGEAVE